jgi:hypothetical protein
MGGLRTVRIERSWILGAGGSVAQTGVDAPNDLGFTAIGDSLITGLTTGVHVAPGTQPLTVAGSAIQGNDVAIAYEPTAEPADARGNWWGTPSGPPPAPARNRVEGDVDTSGFLTAAPRLAVPPGVPDVPDAQPSVTIAGPTRAFEDARPLDVVAEASDDRGVRSVVLRIGERDICTLTAAPYRCTLEPRGAETGPQTLVAVVTDTAGHSAIATRPYRIGRFRPISLSHRSRGRGGRRIQTTGRLTLPAGVAAADACFGTVEIVYRRGRRSAGTRRARIRSNCTYRLTRKLKRGTYRIKPQMVGNDVLLPVGGKERRARAR